jgi:hypothetical protein
LVGSDEYRRAVGTLLALLPARQTPAGDPARLPR